MITLILGLAIVGFLVYLIITYIPMPEIFKTAIVAIAVILIIVYLIQLFGFDIPLPRRG
jgi:hypothetical protein